MQTTNMPQDHCPNCNCSIPDVGARILAGRSAHLGCVSGTVRVVKTPMDLNLLQDGEILVTTQTSPEAVPAILRAAAVVTDRGGVLCHAAIICREYKKPC